MLHGVTDLHGLNAQSTGCRCSTPKMHCYFFVHFSALRVHHLLRCSPSVANSAIETVDEFLRSTVEVALTALMYLTFSWCKCKLLSPLRTAVWESNRCVRLHFQPFRLLLRAPLICNSRFCQLLHVPLKTTQFLRHYRRSCGTLPNKQSFWDIPGE